MYIIISRDTSCAIRFFSEPVPQLRDSWDNTWCYRKPRRYIIIIIFNSPIVSYFIYRSISLIILVLSISIALSLMDKITQIVVKRFEN